MTKWTELEKECNYDHKWKMPANFKGRYFCERCGIETRLKLDKESLMRWFGVSPENLKI